MSLSQIKRDLAGLRESLKPAETANRIIIYDPVQGIPGNLSNSEWFRVYIPDNGRNTNLEL